MRKLATIRLINQIKPIKNADKIACAVVDGWEVVISKNDGFSVGDKIVYIEIDSIMPEKPEFEFLRNRKFRVRTVVMRGQISQGLVLPLSVLPDGKYNVGDDVTDILGVKKYDPELEEENKIVKNQQKKPKTKIGKYLMRFEWFRRFYIKPKSKSSFPDWISKTDEERIQNLPTLFSQLKRDQTVLGVTEKVDGCSATYFLRKKEKSFFGQSYEFGVCSRNQRIVNDNGSHYWQVAKYYDIENVLHKIIGENEYVVLQGEITGKRIQKNKYPINDRYNFWAFNLIYPNGKLSTLTMQAVLGRYNIISVPVVRQSFVIPQHWEIHDLVDFVKGNSQIVKREREGCVFRTFDNSISFKVINPLFLLEDEG